MGLETTNRDAINTTAVGACANAQSVYTNLQPAKLFFVLESSFKIDVSRQAKNWIKEWKFGVVETVVEMVKKDIRGKLNKHEKLILLY